MRHPTVKIIRTAEGHHARIDSAGSRIVWSEPYTRRRGALNALRVAAQAFYPDHLVGVEKHALVIGDVRVPILDVDDRTGSKP